MIDGGVGRELGAGRSVKRAVGRRKQGALDDGGGLSGSRRCRDDHGHRGSVGKDPFAVFYDAETGGILFRSMMTDR
jgi:hypothetical protein